MLRQSYLQRGGSDITILGHLAELEMEASAVERNSKASPPSPPQRHLGSDHWPMQSSKMAAICFKGVTCCEDLNIEFNGILALLSTPQKLCVESKILKFRLNATT